MEDGVKSKERAGNEKGERFRGGREKVKDEEEEEGKMEKEGDRTAMQPLFIVLIKCSL